MIVRIGTGDQQASCILVAGFRRRRNRALLRRGFNCGGRIGHRSRYRLAAYPAAPHSTFQGATAQKKKQKTKILPHRWPRGRECSPRFTSTSNSTSPPLPLQRLFRFRSAVEEG